MFLLILIASLGKIQYVETSFTSVEVSPSKEIIALHEDIAQS